MKFYFMYKSSVLHPFIERLRVHPGFASADRKLIAEAEAHPAYCFASRACMQRWEALLLCRHASRAHAPQWNVYGSSIGLRQRRALLCRGALCALLVRRLMCFKGPHSARNALHHVCCVISRRHFLVSKNAAETLFEKGRRLYREQRYWEATESWGQAAILGHAASHAYLSNLLIEGRKFLIKNEKRAFEFASYGAALDCVHSKGVLGYCLVYGVGVSKDVERGLALARVSAAAGSCFGQFTLGQYHDVFWGLSQNYAEAERLYRLAAAQGHASAQHNLGFMFEVGQGVAKDDIEAFRWYQFAAAQGHADAQCNLGSMFNYGRGVAKNSTEASHWYGLAAAQGHKQAESYLNKLFRIRDGVS
jgi:TPR repeat protein